MSDQQQNATIRNTHDESHRFVDWAQRSAVPLVTVMSGAGSDDLRPLGDMIADAPIVALTEAVHGGAEPLEFRNRLCEYLVEEKGFTAIAIESGLVESRSVYDYVRGGGGELSEVMAQGISWTFDQLPQNYALAEWLATHNSKRTTQRKVNFYGFDVPGSPGNPHANRGVETALIAAWHFLARVDTSAADWFGSRLRPLLTCLRFDPHHEPAVRGYDNLAKADRDELTATIADMLALLERRERQYIQQVGVEEYEWGYRAAIGARQVDAWLRNVPIGWQPVSAPVQVVTDDLQFWPAAGQVRDRAQADNLEWIVRREGPLGKVLVFAHRYHLSTEPVRANWVADQPQDVMGTYLKRRFGDRLVTIGNLIGRGEIESAGERCGDGMTRQLGPSPAGSVEVLSGNVGYPMFLLDLRRAPAPLSEWLARVQPLGRGTPGLGEDVLEVPVGRAFDLLFYIDTVTPIRAQNANQSV